MRTIKHALLILSIFLMALAGVSSAASITIGKGNFYISVGDYDYLPYGYSQTRLPRISFYEMMGDYGTWVTAHPFGRAWRPYVYYDWQPYTYGHWTYTRYGPMWVGYEPWAWVAYHYGNWIWTQNYGWVWLPGYDWHPGRVIWAYSYNTIGWMPAPPRGYNYFCGYLCRDRYSRYKTYGDYQDGIYPRTSPSGYFEFEDYTDYEDYSPYEDYDEYGDQDYGYDSSQYRDPRYPGDRYDPYLSTVFYYDPYFYNPAYLRIVSRLWVFIPVNYFAYDDFSEVFFDSGYIRYLFDRRLVQINRRNLDRVALQNVVRQRIEEQPVQVKQMDTDRGTVRVVVPVREQEKIRTHANRVVKEVIAPAFAEKNKSFKGERARNRTVVTQVFRQPEGKAQQVETLPSETIVREAKQAREERNAKRQQIAKRGMDTLRQAERQGKLEEINRARERAEKSQRQQQPQEKMTKRTVPQGEESASSVSNFENWKKRETAKFTAWKNQQIQEFENWKKMNQDKPEEVKNRAELEFQQRLKKAEEQFTNRTKKVQQDITR